MFLFIKLNWNEISFVRFAHVSYGIPTIYQQFSFLSYIIIIRGIERENKIIVSIFNSILILYEQ